MTLPTMLVMLELQKRLSSISYLYSLVIFTWSLSLSHYELSGQGMKLIALIVLFYTPKALYVV